MFEQLSSAIETSETRTDRGLSSQIIQRETATFERRLSTFLENDPLVNERQLEGARGEEEKRDEKKRKKSSRFVRERNLRSKDSRTLLSIFSCFFSLLFVIHAARSYGTFIRERDSVNGAR